MGYAFKHIIIMFFYCLLVFDIKAQSKDIKIKWNLTAEQDLTFDYYSNALGVYCFSKGIFKLTNNPWVSGLSGLGIGFCRSLFLERGINGKIISGMGAVCGNFIFDIDMNIRNQKQLIKKEHFNNLYLSDSINEIIK